MSVCEYVYVGVGVCMRALASDVLGAITGKRYVRT